MYQIPLLVGILEHQHQRTASIVNREAVNGKLD